MGIGFILIVHPENEAQAMDILQANKEKPVKIGRVVSGQGVSYRLKVAVLSSGRGSNLQELIVNGWRVLCQLNLWGSGRKIFMPRPLESA
jgi:hypothetical protein